MFFLNIIADTKLRILAMIFLIITLFITSIIVAILTSRIKIELENIDFFTSRKKKVKEGYKLKVSIFIFNILKVVNIDLAKIDISKIKNNKKVQKINQKMKEKGPKADIKILNKILKTIQKNDIKIENLNLKLEIGTEDAAVTSFIIAGISGILGILLKSNINHKNKFEVLPIYTNQNLIRLNLDGKFTINLGKFVRKIIKEKIEIKLKNISKNIRKIIRPTKIQKLRKRTYKLKYRLQKIGNTN